MTVAAGATLLLCSPDSMAQQKSHGRGMCDRIRATQVKRVLISRRSRTIRPDQFRRAGVEGYKIKYNGVEPRIQVRRHVVSRISAKGRRRHSIMVYGSPQVQALNQKLERDRSPAPPRFGIAARPTERLCISSSGRPLVRAGAVILRTIGGSSGQEDPTSFSTNPAVASRSRSYEDLQKTEGSSSEPLRSAARGEMGAQVLTSAALSPDFVISHLSAAPRGCRSRRQANGLPAVEVLRLWASGNRTSPGAGGGRRLLTMSFAGSGRLPVRQEIRDITRRGQGAQKAMDAR